MHSDLYETERILATKVLRYYSWLMKSIQGISADKALESATRLVLAEKLVDIDETLWKQGIKINKED
jgi:hypothetical protein